MLILICSAVPGLAAPSLPSYLTFPAQVQMKANSIEEDYGEAEFQLKGQDDPVIQRGRHWEAYLTFSGLAAGTEPNAVWALLRPALLQGGWTILSEQDTSPYMAMLRYQKSGHDTWVSLGIFSAEDMRMDLVEVGAPTLKLTLKPPARMPEVISAKSGDFPYLSPLPGSKASKNEREDAPMLVVSAQDNGDMQVVGSGSLKKYYVAPVGLRSNVLFVTVYRDALTQAGWTIVQQIEGIHASDASLTAHYAANGRDLWAYLHNGGEGYLIQVADAGAEDIGKELDHDCHVALYGVHFDFNKATLRPDSDLVLNRVLALLNARPDLKLEVQGHTDNVGTNDYNQKLSDSRANSVVDWLRAKGIAADRLGAHGYGLSMPIADNGSDEGRAKNRRVELKKPGCGK